MKEREVLLTVKRVKRRGTGCWAVNWADRRAGWQRTGGLVGQRAGRLDGQRTCRLDGRLEWRRRDTLKTNLLLSLSLSVCPQLLFALDYCLPSTVFALDYWLPYYCLPSTTVRPRLLCALYYCLPLLLFALNYCLSSTAVCPQLLFALNCCLPSTNLDIKYDQGT